MTGVLVMSLMPFVPLMIGMPAAISSWRLSHVGRMIHTCVRVMA